MGWVLEVELVSLHEAIDTSTAMGEAMFGMCGVFAQLEVSMLRERTPGGLAAAPKAWKIHRSPP